MSNFPNSQKLLQWVQSRLYMDRLVQRCFWFTMVLAGMYLAGLLGGRLTGLWGMWFEPWTVALVPGLGVIGALLVSTRPTLGEAAHAVDVQQSTKDLYLTLTMLDDSPGEYKPLVGREAEGRAPRIIPKNVVPLQWERQGLISFAAALVLVLGVVFIPTLDPFGKVAEANQLNDQRKLLEDDKKINELRKAQLAQKDTEADNSDEVQQALEALKLGLSKMKKGDRKANADRIKEHQEELTTIYKDRMNSSEMKKLGSSELWADQKLGATGDQDMFRKMTKELQQGSTETMQHQMEELKDKLERLAKTSDPVEKSKLEREVQKQIQELSDFAGNKAGSQALQAALERAQSAMDSMKQEGLSKEAMEALKESLDVAQQEAQLLAQAARDMKSLDEALGLISQAKSLNADDQLDGEMMAGNMTLEDYEEMYAQLMGMQSGQGGEGDGEGTGGRGMGEGGNVPEDDDAKTDFVDEQSKSQIQQGKILLSLKTKGLSDSGDVKDEEYVKVLGDLKQNIEQVIEQEQIPPGYTEGIKKYFDTLESKGE
ncbi:MAG: hypothetical protein KDA88_05120 [Planctomycetaceae bacterium]|nr:hypothetical protein [Planctomycetaceae bacterium]MCB9952374.1 hypothetical protein [Planctomycetaceae bacterium]